LVPSVSDQSMIRTWVPGSHIKDSALKFY